MIVVNSAQLFQIDVQCSKNAASCLYKCNSWHSQTEGDRRAHGVAMTSVCKLITRRFVYRTAELTFTDGFF